MQSKAQGTLKEEDASREKEGPVILLRSLTVSLKRVSLEAWQSEDGGGKVEGRELGDGGLVNKKTF